MKINPAANQGEYACDCWFDPAGDSMRPSKVDHFNHHKNMITNELKVTSKEHEDLMANFEQQFKVKPAREPKDLWKHSIYCDGYINRDFINFRNGYTLAKFIYAIQAS